MTFCVDLSASIICHKEAGMCGHLRMVEMLVERGVSVNETKSTRDWSGCNYGRATEGSLTVDVAMQGNFEVVEYLLKQGASVNGRGKVRKHVPKFDVQGVNQFGALLLTFNVFEYVD